MINRKKGVNRKYWGIEIEKSYVIEAKKRLKQLKKRSII